VEEPRPTQDCSGSKEEKEDTSLAMSQFPVEGFLQNGQKTLFRN
jgi:hypothetical protein